MTAVIYEWNVHTTRAWMNALAPVARRAFKSNHDYVMRNGGVGLAKLLGGPAPGGRLATSACARSRYGRALTWLQSRCLALSHPECQHRLRTSHHYRSSADGGMPMKLKPLGDRLIVQAIEEEETTASGIVLPDTAKEKPQKGKVLAVGDGEVKEDGSRRPLDVNEGDEVLYSKYGGTEITVDGDELLVLRESDVLAKVG